MSRTILQLIVSPLHNQLISNSPVSQKKLKNTTEIPREDASESTKRPLVPHLLGPRVSVALLFVLFAQLLLLLFVLLLLLLLLLLLILLMLFPVWLLFGALCCLCCFPVMCALCCFCGCFFGSPTIEPHWPLLTFQNVKNNSTIDKTPLISENVKNNFCIPKKSFCIQKKSFCIPKKSLCIPNLIPVTRRIKVEGSFEIFEKFVSPCMGQCRSWPQNMH